MPQSLSMLLAPGSRFGVLLTSLILMLFLPFLLGSGLESVLTPVLFTVVLLSSLSAVADTPRHFRVGAALAIPGCGLIVASSLLTSPNLSVLAEITALLFLGYTAIAILGFVLRAQRVDLGIVLGSVCVYLLAALMWGVGYQLVEQLRPGSFSMPGHEADGALRNALQYFSFVTITTLGYGDIQPVTRFARMLSALEAIVGQLYLVILVARLVGLHTALESAKRGA